VLFASQSPVDRPRKIHDCQIVLNTALAANIKSALNAFEVTKIMANTAVKAKTTAARMGANILQKEIRVPTVTAIQAYSLNAGECETAAQRELTIQTMFYAVGLACGVGPLYSVRMRTQADSQCTRTKLASMSQMPEHMSAEVSQKDNTHSVIANMKIMPGIPFTRNLIPESTFARVAVSASCSAAEKQRLKTLGAYMALNKLPAEAYMRLCPASFMPLHLRQSMILCPVSNCLTPLSATQMQNAANFKCGVAAKNPYFAPTNGERFACSAEIETNMHAIYTNFCNVIGCLPVITGTGFSDTMMLVYP